jgi:hypothetical protein
MGEDLGNWPNTLLHDAYLEECDNDRSPRLCGKKSVSFLEIPGEGEIKEESIKDIFGILMEKF